MRAFVLALAGLLSAASDAQHVGFHLPGRTATQYARSLNYRFPDTGSWTVEGWVNVQTPEVTNDQFMFSYAGRAQAQNNCLLVKSRVGTYNVWVHWAMTMSGTARTMTYYVNGTQSSTLGYSTTWCGEQGGSLVIGHDQDSHGGRLDANQAPNIIFDSLRVHNTSLSVAQIAAIANGGSPGVDLYNSWCFSNPDDFGFDSGLAGNNFDIIGGGVAPGFSTCGPVPPMTPGSPIAYRLPGGTNAQYARRLNFNWPANGFTVEGFVKVGTGSGGRYMFSYETGTANCLLVRSRVGTYGVWVHWAMTVQPTTRIVQHYINGRPTTNPRYSTRWCGNQGGSLVLGHDQDSVGGRLDANQAPAVTFDSLRIHTGVLTTAVILNIASGAPPPQSPLHNWCFSNPNAMGADSGTSPTDFEIFGGRPAAGLTSCGTGAVAAQTPQGPQAYHISGGSVSAYAQISGFTFPTNGWTLEGWIQVRPGSGASPTRYMFSYETGRANCLLVKSTMPSNSYGVWVHWAMTSQPSTRTIQHYINGTATIVPRYSTTWCGQQSGSLVLGQDQDTPNGRLDPNQSPNMLVDSLRMHASVLSASQIQGIYSGQQSPPSNPVNNWCFSNPATFGVDTGSARRNFVIHGGRSSPGLSNCTAAAGTYAPRPVAFHLPGGQTTQFARRLGYRFPTTGFTVEGYVMIGVGDAGKYMFSYEARNGANCLLVRARVGYYGQWVHWAMTVDASTRRINHYINGTLSPTTAYSTTWCGIQGGSLILGHDQDSVGGRLDHRQAPNVRFDGLRVHNTTLSVSQIQAIANGGAFPTNTIYNNWCFSNPDNFGFDSGPMANNFDIYGGDASSGVTTCGVAPPLVTGGPRAFRLPGGTTAQYTRALNYRFPNSGGFSVEGFLKVAPGSAGRYMFSYEAAGGANCLLVRSTVGTYGVWVHWGMTVDTNRRIQHYINGRPTTSVRYSTTWCGIQGGSLVLGHDQDSVGGRLDARQAPAVTFDTIRVHTTMLTPAQILSLAAGNPPLSPSTLWSSYCFTNPANVGEDLGTQRKDFEIYGGVQVAGLTTCATGGVATAPVPTGPQAWQLEGGTTSSFLKTLNYNFPTGAFTVEGWINVQPGSGLNRYMFSYAAPNGGSDNCLLVRATVGTYGVWVHWGMTVNSARTINHYINGTLQTSLLWSTSWCGIQGGSLVLGQDQDTHGARFDPNQAPNILFDSLRVHSALLTPAQLQSISNGGVGPSPRWNNWCFTQPNVGYDAGTAAKNFTVFGGRPAPGYTDCFATASPTAAPTSSPTVHPCNGQNTCDQATTTCGQTPSSASGRSYTCECRPGYMTNPSSFDNCIMTPAPTPFPTTQNPTTAPTARPTLYPTFEPTTAMPTARPTTFPTFSPTPFPTPEPTERPTSSPVEASKSGIDNVGGTGVSLLLIVVVVAAILVVIVLVVVFVKKNNKAAAPQDRQTAFANPLYGNADVDGNKQNPAFEDADTGYMDVNADIRDGIDDDY